MMTGGVDPILGVITPAKWIRVTYLALGCAIAVVAILFMLMPTTTALRVLDVAIAGFGIAFGVRMMRSRIDVRTDSVQIHGVFSRRTLQRAQVTSVETFPFIDWRSASGLSRRSCVFTFLGVTNGDDSNARAVRNARDQLRQWASGSNVSPTTTS